MKGILRAFALVSLLSVAFLGPSTTASATSIFGKTTHKVAYIYDPSLDYAKSQGCDAGTGHGVNDESSPTGTQGCPGESIFSNAIPPGTPIGTGDTGSYGGVTFSNLPIASLDANPTVLASYDTVLLYQVCTFGNASHATGRAAINSFLAAGGKIMIFDADACGNPNNGGLGNVDYSGFLFPFTTSSPGPAGASGSYTKIESSTLTTGLATGVQPFDAVGDANTFTSNAGGWCGSITATNTNRNNGFVEAYARTATGGLVIYEGEDFWYTDEPAAHLKKVFDLVLDQGWSPDGLPCGTPTSGIKLEPATDTKTVGQTETLTATVTDSTGAPKSEVTVTFMVTAGPDATKTGHASTDANGKATFALSDTTQPGVDKVKATFVDGTGGVHSSNESDITWVAAGPLISLSPASDSKPVHQRETLTATVKNSAGVPQRNVLVSFMFDSGPDAPRPVSTATTDSNGNAQLSFTNGGTAGVDKIHAAFADEGGTHSSNDANITFTPVVLPATGGGSTAWLGLLLAAMLLFSGLRLLGEVRR